MRNNLSTKPNVSPRNHPLIPSLISDIPLHYSTTLSHSYKVSGTVISVRLRKSHVSFILRDPSGQLNCELHLNSANRRYPEFEQIICVCGVINKEKLGDNQLELKVSFYKVTNDVQELRRFSQDLMKQKQSLSIPIIMNNSESVSLRNFVFIVCVELFKNNPDFSHVELNGGFLFERWKRYSHGRNFKGECSVKTMSRVLEEFEEEELISGIGQREWGKSNQNERIFTVERELIENIFGWVLDILRFQERKNNEQFSFVHFSKIISQVHQKLFIFQQQDHVFNQQGLYCLMKPLITNNTLFSFRNHLALI